MGRNCNNFKIIPCIRAACIITFTTQHCSELVYTMDKCTLFAFNRCAALMLTTTTTTATTMATATTPPAFHIQVSPQKLKVQNGGKILYFKVSVVHREVHLYRFSFVDVHVQFVQVFARSMCDALHIN